MAALPYMQLYIADYLADTLHLSTVEHGAYLLLLMNYWQTGKPLPDNDKRLANIAKLTLAEWMKHRDTLAEFFTVTDGVWVQKRMEIDLDKVRAKSEKAQSAGKKSASKRWGNRKVTPVIASVATEVTETLQRNGNHTDTDTEANTDTDVDPPKPPMANCGVPIPYSDIIDLYHSLVARTPGQKTTSRGPYTLKQIEQRWYEDKERQSIDWWREYFTRASQSAFLRKIKTSLNWLTEQDHMEKLCNGHYDGEAFTDRNSVASAPSQEEYERENAEYIQRQREREATRPRPVVSEDEEEEKPW